MGRNNEVRDARPGDVLHIENAAAARARFPRDPLIDGPEPIKPLHDRKASL
jgi:CRP/FNR family transcriptional regulator, transcriptional activator FtrB